MLVSDYNYDLPEERIAKFPPKRRGSTRLLVLDRETGAIQDSKYRDLGEFLNPGDVLILNDTRVMQSRLFCQLPDGRKRELVVLEKHGDEPQRVMYRGKLHEDDELTVLHGKFQKRSAEESVGGYDRDRRSAPPVTTGWHDSVSEADRFETCRVRRILGNGIAEVESDTPLADLAERYGTVPLPPYLHRDATADDKERYQTVWAEHMGSAAAPTASLNMTKDLLRRLEQKGVIIKYLTLHVGLGTFLPIRSDRVEDHEMHSEWFHIPDDTITAIASVGGRAQATLSARDLERRRERMKATSPVTTGARRDARAKVSPAPMFGQYSRPEQHLYAVVQGGDFLDLRAESAKYCASKPVDGFGIGGIFTARGLDRILETVNTILPDDKPRHLLGMGQEPLDLFIGAGYGCDTFDCVGPTRMARNGSLYTLDGRINIKNAKFKHDFTPIMPECNCECCKNYNKAYLRHLFKTDEITAKVLASVHNEHFVVQTVANIRSSLLDGTFKDYRQSFLSRYYQK